MRILITADPMLPVPPRLYGGIERIIDLLVSAHQEAGHTVGLVAHRDSSTVAAEQFSWPSERHDGPGVAWKSAAVLRKAVDSFVPDVIHSFSRLLWLLGLVSDPRPKIMSYQRQPSGRTVRLSRYAHRRRLEFTGCSEYISREGRTAGGGRWTAIPNGVKLSTYTFRSEVPADAPLLFLGRVEPIKGCHTAIEIAKRCGRRLIIAGNHSESGEEGNYWRERILPEIGSNGIEYAGPVDDRQKNELLGQSVALVGLVEWDEPFGIVFVESLACGTPVISTARGALREIVESGKHGFLVSSVEEGIQAVNKIASVQRKDCRRRVEERFDGTLVACAYRDLYQRMIAELS